MDLALALGLDLVQLGDACSMDMHTLRGAIDRLPGSLLELCGVRTDELVPLRALLADRPSPL